MNSLSLNMTSIEVKAEVRTLKCEWTRELTKDLSLHSSLNIDDFAKELVRQQRVQNRKKSIKNLFC